MNEKNDLPLKPDATPNSDSKLELRRAFAKVFGVSEEVADKVIGETFHEMAAFYEQSVKDEYDEDDENNDN